MNREELHYYNEWDEFCCDVLRARIADGTLPAGFVDHRDIQLVQPDDVAGYAQCHFFAGIGGFPLGIKWAGAERLRLWTGGFPCQDISLSGPRAGIDGKRSGLWGEFFGLIRAIRPDKLLVENVAAMLIPDGERPAAISRVLGDLAAIGFDAEWDCLPASAFGAYHERDRTFIVAHAAGVHGDARNLLEASGERRSLLQSGRLHRMAVAARAQRENIRLEREPGLVRLVHGIPHRTQRLAALGNAIYPGIVEQIARGLITQRSHP